VADFDQALLALGHLPKSRDTLAQAIDLRLDLRNALNPFREDARILDCLREAETLAEALGDQHRLGQVAAHMTQYFWAKGDYERALTSGQRALAMATDLGDVGLNAMAHLLQALALAKELGMRPLQAHCHRGLGTLYAQRAQRQQARTALSMAIDMYRAMEMTFWLPQAEALLAQVEGQ
jgi:tetratricopeptide (TPR) repeat protein